MPDRIRLLPDVVANQIAAGEVVVYPANAVKEMMENAVDAGATSVTVNFRDGGKELVQVVDNGCGMSPIDARMAFDRHATSKIARVDDIYAISTFGFRGEALASIAAVAEVEVRTRQAGDDYGTSVEIAGGQYRSQNSINCPVGTQFFVKNLFYNVPARRRFLEKSTVEARRIKEEFRRVALCNPQTAFQLYENDAPLFNLPPAPLRQRIVGVIGKNIANNLLEVKADTTLVKIEGFVGRPAASKQNNTEHYLFVNGRYFDSPYFRKAILAAYEKLIPSNTRPSYFLYLTIDPERIDVNVHPQKTEVRFEDGSALWQIINAAVRESLGKLGALPMMDFDMDTSIEIPVHRQGVVYKSPEIHPNPEFNPFIEKASDVSSVRSYAAGEYTDFRSSMDVEEDVDRSLIEFIEGEDAWQGTLEIDGRAAFGRPIGIDGRYCATTLGGELLVVDIPRAWEAVLYERYAQLSGAVASQMLLFPLEAGLSIEECCLAREHREALRQAGFDFTLADEQTAVITAMPADFTEQDAGTLFRELLDALSGALPADGLRNRRLAAALARAGAARRQAVDEAALQQLLDALAECSQANFTPSGLSVVLKITQNEIKRRL